MRKVHVVEGEVAAYYDFAYDGDQVIAEYASTTAVPSVPERTFVYGAYIDEPIAMDTAAGERYYFVSGATRSIALLLGESEPGVWGVVERYAYEDFGEAIILDAAGAQRTASAFGNPYLFQGRRFDEELGLYYYRNRYYDPIHGRFTSRDPLGFWGDPANMGNPYTFLANNPWTYVDPWGLCGKKSWGEWSADIWSDVKDATHVAVSAGAEFGISVGESGLDFISLGYLGKSPAEQAAMFESEYPGITDLTGGLYNTGNAALALAGGASLVRGGANAVRGIGQLGENMGMYGDDYANTARFIYNGASEVFVYTSAGTASAIRTAQTLGRYPGELIYTTNNGSMAANQARTSLALPPGNTASDIFHLPLTSELRSRFIRVNDVLPEFGQPGGGIEIVFRGQIPLP